MAGATPQQTTTPSQFDELKEIVSQTLEKQGILAKAQAQLRKHVFEALSLQEQKNKETYNVAPQIDENSIYDKFCMALIRDYLLHHHLDYTLSLMNTETQKKMECTKNITRNEIASKLNLGAQKPSPDTTLLKQLVQRLFDGDVLKPRYSVLEDDVKLKPRPSADSYRSTLESTTNTTLFIPQSQSQKNEENKLENIAFSKLPSLNDLPPIAGSKRVDDIAGGGGTLDINLNPFDQTEPEKEKETEIEIKTETEIEMVKEAEIEDFDNTLDDLLESSSNNEEDEEEEEEEEEDENEELKRLEEMNKTMEQLKQQTSEFGKFKKSSASPSQSDIYEDDFGSEDMMDDVEQNGDGDNENQNDEEENKEEQEDDINIDEIDDDIDEEIEIDDEELLNDDDDDDGDSNTNEEENIYAAE